MSVGRGYWPEALLRCGVLCKGRGARPAELAPAVWASLCVRTSSVGSLSPFTMHPHPTPTLQPPSPPPHPFLSLPSHGAAQCSYTAPASISIHPSHPPHPPPPGTAPPSFAANADPVDLVLLMACSEGDDGKVEECLNAGAHPDVVVSERALRAAPAFNPCLPRSRPRLCCPPSTVMLLWFGSPPMAFTGPPCSPHQPTPPLSPAPPPAGL